MKKSFVVSVQQTSFNAVAMKSNLEENLHKLASLGYDGVELAIRNPEEVDVEEIVALCQRYQLEIVAIGTGQAWGDEGLSLTDPALEIRKKAVERIKSHIRFSSHFQAQIIIGLLRGIVQEGVTSEKAMEWLVEGFQECADYAVDYPGVVLTLEPINRYETTIINDLREGVDFLNQVDRDNVKILMDSFHMNIEDADMAGNIRFAGDAISHVHFADSNRWAPGWGHIDFPEIITALKDIGYLGYISGEIMPRPTPETCAEETIKYLKKLGL